VERFKQDAEEVQREQEECARHHKVQLAQLQQQARQHQLQRLGFIANQIVRLPGRVRAYIECLFLLQICRRAKDAVSRRASVCWLGLAFLVAAFGVLIRRRIGSVPSRMSHAKMLKSTGDRAQAGSAQSGARDESTDLGECRFLKHRVARLQKELSDECTRRKVVETERDAALQCPTLAQMVLCIGSLAAEKAMLETQLERALHVSDTREHPSSLHDTVTNVNAITELNDDPDCVD